MVHSSVYPCEPSNCFSSTLCLCLPSLSASVSLSLLRSLSVSLSSGEIRTRLRQDGNSRREGTDEALYLARILETAAEGAVSLLRELPREHFGSLRLMLNQPVPSCARLDTWRILLKHTAASRDA